VTVTPFSSVTTASVDVSEEDEDIVDSIEEDIVDSIEEDIVVGLAVGSTGASVGIPGTVGLAPEQQETRIMLK